MPWILASAVMAVLLILLNAAALFYPLLYSMPLHFALGDGVNLVTIAALVVGAIFAVRQTKLSVLLAAWSWSLALQSSALVRVIENTSDFTSNVQAHQFDVQLAFLYFIIPMIGLALLVIGQLRLSRVRKN